MDAFVYEAPKATLRNRIQYITMEVVEGRYAGHKVGACGDTLDKVENLIARSAFSAGIGYGYTKSDIVVMFDTGWEFHTGFDIRDNSTVYDLLDQIDREGRYYNGEKPAHMTQEQYAEWMPHMNPDKVDGFTKLFATPQFNR